jgi:hypothetical protein
MKISGLADVVLGNGGGSAKPEAKNPFMPQ